ncbi:MAG TPA: response regulator [Streptosporangiaceae bacterium]|nr:response regulator [Streptosporangiaceae bacterium]
MSWVLPAGTPEEQSWAMTAAAPQAGVRILLVEDDGANRALVRAVLARSADPELRGACIVEAGDLAQARTALTGPPVDVVLLDMGLPDGNGLELAAELRNTPDGRPPAVVAVTGGTGPGQAHEAIAAGCREVLTKPYAAADLCDVLAAALRADRAAPDAG